MSQSAPAGEWVDLRNSGIDLLRGVSILLVIVHHLALPFRLPLRDSVLAEVLSPRLIGALSYNGYSSVYCFFVISGYLICRRALQRYGSLQSIRLGDFALRRASRILPLLLALLALLCLLHLAGVPGFVIEKPGQSLPGALAAALGLYLNWYEGQTTWLPAAWDVLWSLSIEELFYLLFPLVCWLLPRWLLLPALALLVISLPWTRALLDGQEIWQEKAYLPAMSALALGVLCALLARAWQPSRGFVRCLWALGLLGLLASMLCGGELWRTLRHHSFLLLIASVAALVLSCEWGQLSAPRGLHWLARMGRLSYELYLTHVFVVLAALALYRWGMGDDAYWTALAYPPAIMLCVWLAARVERHLSQPCERALRARLGRA